MSKSRFRTQFNPDYQGYEGFSGDPLSLTVPDMSMTIREILLRYSQGLGAPQSRPMFFAGDQDYPDLDRMSDLDQIDYYRAVIADVDAKKAEANALRTKRLKAVQAQRDELDLLRRRVAEYDLKAANAANGVSDGTVTT